MSQLDCVITSLKENDFPTPTPEEVAEIRAMAKEKAVNRRSDERVERIYGQLAKTLRAAWGIQGDHSFALYRGEMARVPEDDGTEFKEISRLRAIHRQRFADISGALGNLDVRIEDGGLKSVARVHLKAEEKLRLGEKITCSDLTRMRVVTPDLRSLGSTYVRLRQFLKEVDLFVVTNSIHYSDLSKRHETPFRGILISFCGLNEENPDDQIATEIQFVTRRMRMMLSLNHPFDVSKELAWPSKKAKAYVHRLMNIASILDLQEYIRC